MGNSKPLKERQDRIIGLLAILVAMFSIAIFIGFSAYIQSFLGIFKQLGGEFPFLTKFIVLSYPWLWLGAVLSGITWGLHRQRLLSKYKSVTILCAITICTLAYAVVGGNSLYLTLLKMFELVK
jgi:hypothetical protein